MLCLFSCISVGTSALAACVTTGVLECDRTHFAVLSLNAAVLVQMPCLSHHRGGRMAFTLQLYCCWVSICSAAKASNQELYVY